MRHWDGRSIVLGADTNRLTSSGAFGHPVTVQSEPYRTSSWIDPRIETRDTSARGRGSFARALIRAGEVVTIWGGQIFSIADVAAGKTKKGTVAAIAEDRVLAAPAGASAPDDQFLNHSCDPNVWLRDEVTLIVRRDIAAGEELTADYVFWEYDEDYVARWECACGSSFCRGRITGRDWRRRDLQERYNGHFSPFINERIARLKSAPNR